MRSEQRAAHVGESLRDSQLLPRLGETRLRTVPRRGMTLVELLVVILIIAILGAMVIGVAAVAGETAREAKTRGMISRLHTLLAEHMDTYKNRRVRLEPTVEQTINENTTLTGVQKGQSLAAARLYALRELMLMEVPDRWSDVLLNAVDDNPSTNDWLNPLYLAQRTDLSSVYLRRYQRLVGRTNTVTDAQNTGADIIDNQGAECLYMVITLATGDGEARSLFGESSIGDTDGDGAPEFLDGWGNPIHFLRWAPGFDSEIQINANALDTPPTGTAKDAWEAAGLRDHDPYDVFRMESLAIRLVPLIYSAGRDEKLGMVVAPDLVPWRLPGQLSVSNTEPYITPQLIPYFRGAPNWSDKYLGTDDGTKTATDNIHNHLIGER